jgi:hypothetical protein
VVRELCAIDTSTRVVVLTGYGSIATAVEAMRLGAVNYLPKPADVDEVLGAFDAPSLARAEWEHINRVLGDCTGNISEAARRLGVTGARCSASSRSTRRPAEPREPFILSLSKDAVRNEAAIAGGSSVGCVPPGAGPSTPAPLRGRLRSG